MRWKEGNTNFVTGEARVAGGAEDLCVYDNGTIICDVGYKLKSPKYCLTQSRGVFNTLDFEPSFPVCYSSYLSKTSRSVSVISKSVGKDGHFTISNYTDVLTQYNQILKSFGQEQQRYVYTKSLYSSFLFSFLSFLDIDPFSYSQYLRYFHTEGSFSFLSRNSGGIGRRYDSFSDSFSLDVFSTVSVVHPYYFSENVIRESVILVNSFPSGFYHEIKMIVEGEEDFCVGDNTPPNLENVVPISSSVLNSSSGDIGFDVVDAVGGVNKSSIYVTVSGSETLQPEGTLLVEAGVPASGVYFEGSPERYSFLYTPSITWAQNEKVTITVTGTDLVPNDSGGNPFSCYEGQPNPFGQEWFFKVQNIDSFVASITAIGDTYPPYLTEVLPIRWKGGVPSDSDISFYILDDHAGVDLDTLFIYIGGVPIVSYGVPLIDNVSVSSSPGGCFFYYTNTGNFSYGDRIYVRVYVFDSYALSPNLLDYTYYFDIIDDSTLRIENFSPGKGITTDPHLVNISVNIIDEVYDIDDSDLYININGEVCLSSVDYLYDNRYLTSTVSGITTLGGVSVYDGVVQGLTLTGASVSGSYVTGGILSEGYVHSGEMCDFPSPFNTTISGSIISSYMEDGYVSSFVSDTVLVSGINWDGGEENSTITSIDASNFYSYNTTVTGTIISGTVGRTLTYHPPNDFNYGSPINVLVHATNKNTEAPVTIEKVYQLLYGYNVKVFNRRYNNNSRVNIYLGAENLEEFSNRLDYSFYFTTIAQSSKEMSASINGTAPWVDFIADITPQGPIHRYGETIQVEVYVEDVEGNALGPYTFSYTIEEAPF